MKPIFSLLFLLISSFVIGQSSSIDQLEKQLKEAESTKEKMLINYQLAEAYLRVDTKKSIEYGKEAYGQSVLKKDDGMSARAAYIIANGYERKRDYRNAEIWYKSTFKSAKIAGDSDLIIKSVDARSKLALKGKNKSYRKAYQITEEAFIYFSKNSKNELGSDAQKLKFEKEKRQLQKEKDELNFQINNLRSKNEQLTKDKKVLEKKLARQIKQEKKRN